jgi:sugar lactone lactonase YvrE
VRAPDFPPGADWINTGRPLTMRELRGKVVLLDFWTYCCINCMHILPDLKRLERKYANELVVVGVHSPKFTAERDTENVRQAVLRYEIEHPVLSDPQMWLWRQYCVRAWPSVVLVDPQGKVIGGYSGEGIYEPFDQIIAKVIESFDREGLIDRRPLDLVREKAPPTELAFPGKVLADAASDRLFLADSNHNRILVASLEGEVRDEIAGGFQHPNGMALDGRFLYVADTENHALQRVDLETRSVETVDDELNSPWDLVLHDGVLYIAMAGPHQLWYLNLASGELGVWAGTGREARIDGPLLESALAQPSGITAGDGRLYFADSETSSIRAADLDPRGRVTTIVGEDLFEYGDADGIGEAVRLQHPLGVAWVDGVLYVADTYNNKIKQVFPATRAARAFAGSGRAGLRDGSLEEAEFDEPAGISAAGGRLYVADTNNHAIRVIDLAARRVCTLDLREPGK